MLLPIEHEYRLQSPADAEAFFRGLHFFGSRASVGVRGHHTTDPTRIERLVNAIEPKRDHQISFGAGKMDLASMDRLAKERFHYFDLATTAAVYRSWPDLTRTWVYANTAGAETVTFADIAAALAEFGAMAGEELRGGFINGVREETKPFLVEFLRACQCEVHVNLHIDFAPARALADIYAGEEFEWADEEIMVDFPEGRIHGFLVTPKVEAKDQAKWRDRITKALRKASLL